MEYMLGVINSLIGDQPVSEQLSAALDRMADKEHTHECYASRDEVEELRKKVELLIELIGDTSVAEQISAAINNNE